MRGRETRIRKVMRRWWCSKKIHNGKDVLREKEKEKEKEEE